MTLASDIDIITNLIVSQACVYVGGHKSLFTLLYESFVSLYWDNILSKPL